MAEQPGSSVSIPGLRDEIRRLVDEALGDRNIAPGGLTFGKMVDGGPVGKTDLRYAALSTKEGTYEYEVKHACGYVPAFAILATSENRQTPKSTYSVSAIERDKWTDTTIRVTVDISLAGSLDGGLLWFIIGGHR